MKKAILIVVLILGLGLSLSLKSNAETVEDLVQALNDIQGEIKSLSSSDSEEAKIIDQSLEEINKVTNFAIEKIESKDMETAKAALAYSSKSIGDVGKIVPKEFESDMSNADIGNFAPEKMETLKKITTGMNENKQEKENLLLDQIIGLNDIGFNTSEISGRLAPLGINTVTMIELDNRKFDKIKNEIVDNQLEISEKQENLKQLEDELDPLENQIQSLEGQKQAITDKYNADIAVQTTKGKELTEQYNKDVEKISLQISQSQSEASDIDTKIDNLNSEVDSGYKNINGLTKEVTDFNNKLQENSTLVSSKQTELNNLQSSLPALDKQINDLNTEKQTLTLQYEQELANQAKLSLTPEELEKSKNLTEQINNEIGNVSNKINQVGTQTSDLSIKISSLSSEVEQNNLATTELSQKVASFNIELQNNSTLETSKQTQLSNLQSSLPLLENQINNLNSEKQDLTNQYNDELAKQAGVNISAADLKESQQFSDKINKDINNVSTKISRIETQSINLNGKINNITNDINSNITEANQLNQKVVSLKNELQQSSSLISSKQAKLNNLQTFTSYKDSALDQLDKEINDHSLQRDFAIVQNNKNVSKEIDAFEQFAHVLTVGYAKNDDQYERELVNSLREVDVILSPDPKQHRAFDINKYGTIAGLSEDVINKGIDAVYKDDWETQKNVARKIFNNLNNVNRELVSGDTFSFQNNMGEAELNVLMAEEQAKDKSIYAVLDSINKGVIGPSGEERSFAEGLKYNVNIAYHPAFSEAYDKAVNKEVNNIIDTESFKDQTNYLNEQYQDTSSELKSLEDTTKELYDTYYSNSEKANNLILISQGTQNREYLRISEEYTQINKDIQKQQSELIDMIPAARADPDVMRQYQAKANNLRMYTYTTQKEYYEKQRLISQEYLKNNEEVVMKEVTKLQSEGQAAYDEALKNGGELRKLQMSGVEIESQLSALNNKVIEEAKKIVEIKQQSILDDVEATYGKEIKNLATDVERMLSSIPTISQKQINQVNSLIYSGKFTIWEDPDTYAAKMKAILYDDKGDGFYSNGMSKVYDMLYEQESGYSMMGYQITEKMTKVEMAAMTQSRLNGTYMSDYDGYWTAKYYAADRLDGLTKFSSSQRKELSSEFNKLFPNKEIIVLENKLALLNDNLSRIKSQASTSSDELKELKNEINAAEKSKKQLETQISNFNKDLEKKVVQVNTDVKTLNDLEQKLTPINSQLASLKSEKTNLTVKLDDQIAKATKDFEAKTKFDAETSALKDQYDKEMQSLAVKIDGYQSESKTVSQSIDTINNELIGIKSNNTELQNQITSINDQINQNQININTKQTSLNSLQEQLVPLSGQLDSLKSEKTDLSAKLDSQIEAIAKEIEEKGRASLEGTALKEKYEADLSQLTTKISSIETQSKSTAESINLLNSDLSKIQAKGAQLKGQISNLNDQISTNQTNIDNKKTSLNSLEQQIANSNTEIQTLNDSKKGLSIKLEEQALKVAKELESTGEISAENLALKQAYESQLTALNKKINGIEIESNSINSSMNAINLELNQLEEIQKITATRASELVPDAALSIKFNYENTSISKDAAKVGAISLGKSEAEWASSWKGNIATTKIIDGNVVNLSEDDIQSVKADLAMESAIHALATGEISKDLSIDTSELSLATVVSTSVMTETLKRQSEYLSYAISEGMHEMTPEAAMQGVKSLGKSESEWAASWTGSDPTHHNVNGVKVLIGAEEAQKIKAEWAMNRAAQAIVNGENFTDGSINFDKDSLSDATAAATTAAIQNVQDKAADIASQVASTAEAVQNFDTSSLSDDMAAATKALIASSSDLQTTIAQNAISTVAELEDQLDISVEALVSDTSSWTEAQWASSWTGDPPTHHNVNGVRVPIGEAEAQKIKAEWAKNQAGNQ